MPTHYVQSSSGYATTMRSDGTSCPDTHLQTLPNMTIPTGETAIMAGPVTINAGTTVTLVGTAQMRII